LKEKITFLSLLLTELASEYSKERGFSIAHKMLIQSGLKMLDVVVFKLGSSDIEKIRTSITQFKDSLIIESLVDDSISSDDFISVMGEFCKLCREK
jgi:hypothetical protein